MAWGSTHMWQTHGQSTTHRSLRRTQFFYLFSRSLSLSSWQLLPMMAAATFAATRCGTSKLFGATSTWSWKAVAAVIERERERERELQSWGPGVIIDTVDVCFLSISKVRDRATLKQQIPPATCHPLGVAAAAAAAVPLATRSLAVPHCNKSCDFSQLKLSRALPSLFGLFRFSLFAVFNLSLEAKVAKLVPSLTRLMPSPYSPPPPLLLPLLDGMLFACWVPSIPSVWLPVISSFGLLLSLKGGKCNAKHMSALTFS